MFVCAGTKQQGPMAGSQEADVEQYDNGGLLDKIKKAFLRGLESLQYELKKKNWLMCVALCDFNQNLYQNSVPAETFVMEQLEISSSLWR